MNITLGNFLHALFIGSSMFFNSLRLHMFAELMAGFSILITAFLIAYFFVRARITGRAASYAIVLAITMAAIYIPLVVLIAVAFKKYDVGQIINYAGLALMFLAFDSLYWLIFTQVNYFMLRVKKVQPSGACPDLREKEGRAF